MAELDERDALDSLEDDAKTVEGGCQRLELEELSELDELEDAKTVERGSHRLELDELEELELDENTREEDVLDDDGPVGSCAATRCTAGFASLVLAGSLDGVGSTRGPGAAARSCAA